MSEHCDTCNEHSGMKSSNKLLIWLLAILITIGLAQVKMMFDLNGTVTAFAYRIQNADMARAEIKSEIMALKQRVDRIEYQAHAGVK